MTPFVTAGAGFLAAVLWFDLMHDVLVLRLRPGGPADPVLSSLAAYYRRVTTDARPMNRLVSVVMLGTVAAVVGQLAVDDEHRWAAAVSLVLVLSATLLAVVRTVRNAIRLGRRTDPPTVQVDLARSIFGDHVYCLCAIGALLVVQLSFAR